jgi:hypothetical protein
MTSVKATEKAPQPAAPAPVPAPVPKQIKAVYGLMVDPHTGLHFNLQPCELLKLTPWVQSQLDAGKLTLVG